MSIQAQLDAQEHVQRFIASCPGHLARPLSSKALAACMTPWVPGNCLYSRMGNSRLASLTVRLCSMHCFLLASVQLVTSKLDLLMIWFCSRNYRWLAMAHHHCGRVTACARDAQYPCIARFSTCRAGSITVQRQACQELALGGAV